MTPRPSRLRLSVQVYKKKSIVVLFMLVLILYSILLHIYVGNIYVSVYVCMCKVSCLVSVQLLDLPISKPQRIEHSLPGCLNELQGQDLLQIDLENLAKPRS